MKLAVVAVGRLKAGPERELIERYRERIDALGRAHGFSPVQVVEIAESRARRAEDRRAEEAAAILEKAAPDLVVVFDERGQSLGSDAFAARLAGWRDQGRSIACVIGGPDGLDASVRQRADLVLSFGALTLPHQLVRVLVLEQLYRALTIIARHPYHRASDES